jgi:hypothetical protein
MSAYVETKSAAGVHHDCLLPSMSAVRAFGWEFPQVDGRPYLPRVPHIPGSRLRVGIRWKGNPAFEHEQHRRFPHAWMFALEGVDLVNLQDEPSEVEGVITPSLASWADTVAELSRLDLLITSCTSIAHLAGAMGIPTWILVPILPYYLWALPGDTTPWYESVRLYRQETVSDWEVPINHIINDLTNSEVRLCGSIRATCQNESTITTNSLAPTARNTHAISPRKQSRGCSGSHKRRARTMPKTS